MNRNIIIVLAGGVLIAVLVAVLVQASLNSNNTAPQPVEEAKVQVLVAANDLKVGEDLKPEDLRWQEWPKSAVFPGAVVKKDDMTAKDALVGRLNRDIAAGEPVLESSIIMESTDNLATILPKGMRAIAINVKADTMAGGFVGPGDYVDVILTYQAPRLDTRHDKLAQKILENNIDKYASETILENIKVLAVDQMAQRDEDAKVGRTVTLAVAPVEAEKLALSVEMGDLMLALRSIGDGQLITKKWPVVTDRRIISVLDEVEAEYLKKKAEINEWEAPTDSENINTTGVNPSIVRIYNGSSVSNVTAH